MESNMQEKGALISTIIERVVSTLRYESAQYMEKLVEINNVHNICVGKKYRYHQRQN